MLGVGKGGQNQGFRRGEKKSIIGAGRRESTRVREKKGSGRGRVIREMEATNTKNKRRPRVVKGVCNRIVKQKWRVGEGSVCGMD